MDKGNLLSLKQHYLNILRDSNLLLLYALLLKTTPEEAYYRAKSVLNKIEEKLRSDNEKP